MSHSDIRDQWLCLAPPLTIIMAPRSSAQRYLTIQNDAHNDEESGAWWDTNHNPDWNAPLEEDPPLTRDELQMREHQYHVERVADIVPYWIKCVEAAAKGEELRLEPFLNSLKDASQSWMTSDNPWALTSGPGAWGDTGDADRWGVHPDKGTISSSRGSNTQAGTRSRTAATGGSATGRAPDKRKGRRARTNMDHQKTAYAFVEDIARQEAADAQRKRRMHKFYEMSTEEKVQKITEIVRYLRSGSA
ncbi:hypothetical protein B0H15DRAFT_813121 [Mycena belliarum]|uniref:Uncharacterized protein n=1 Tax=Mycena belliarum TaxID=1033014 RepID=A0AAD6UL44_9AGAR|nr:hypothetical protein B0H15DRAFT_813121 [Mycena belliae]